MCKQNIPAIEVHVNNSLHLAQTYARIYTAKIIRSEMRTMSFEIIRR